MYSAIQRVQKRNSGTNLCISLYTWQNLAIMAPIVLKIKGNKSFSPFSHMASEDELSKTWRVCTKVKDSLENGSRLENLSWRLWFVHNVLNDNAKAAAFRRLPSSATLHLDKEKGPLSPMKRTARKKDKVQISQQQSSLVDITATHTDSPLTIIPTGPTQLPNKTKTTNGLEPPTTRVSELEYKRTLRQQQLKQARLCQPSQTTTTSTLPQQIQKQPPRRKELTRPQQPQDQPIHTPQLQQNQYTHQPPQYSTLLEQQQSQHTQYPNQPQIQQNGMHHSTPYSSPLNQQMIEEFVLHQYTSDQACDQVVQIQNTFNDKTNNHTTAHDINNYLRPKTSPLVEPTTIANDITMGMAPPLNNSHNNRFYTDTNPPPHHDLSSTQHSAASASFFNMANQTACIDNNNHTVYDYDYTATVAAVAAATAAASIPSTPNLSSPFDIQPSFYDSNVTQEQQTIAPLQPSHHHRHQQQQQQSTCHPIYEEMDTLQDFLNSSAPVNSLTHNKLLATLPAETLASAERVLLPANQLPIETRYQQQQQHIQHSNDQQRQPQNQYRLPPQNMSQHHPPPHKQQHQLTPTSSLSTPNYHATTPSNFQQVNLSAPTTPFPQPSPLLDRSVKSLSRPTSPTTEKRQRTPLVVNSTPSEGKAPICSNCESTSTPLWRRSADDDLLCNACGL